MNTRSMLALTALACAALLTSAVAFAGPNNAGPDRDHGRWNDGPPTAEEKLARLDQALDLDDAQAVALLEVLQSVEAEREMLHARVMEQYQPEVCALMTGTHEAIIAILTPEQTALWEQLQAERAKRTEGRTERARSWLECPTDGG